MRIATTPPPDSTTHSVELEIDVIGDEEDLERDVTGYDVDMYHWI